MKKIIVFAAALTLVGAMSLSCQKNNGQEEKEKVTLEDPTHLNDALCITFGNVAEENALSIGGVLVCLEKAFFTEGGKYILTGRVPVKALSDKYTHAGKYSFSNGTYNLPGVGSITVSGNSVVFKTESGQEVKFEGVKIEKPKLPEGNNEKNMVRSWKPSGLVKVSIPSKGLNTSLEPSLKSVADYLAAHEFNVDPSDYEGYDIASIDLSMAEKSFFITFANGEAYVGSWNWTNQEKGEFSYGFSSEWGGELIQGSATGTASFGANSCAFTMSITVKGHTANLAFTLVQDK